MLHSWIFWITLAYFVGSIPFGLLISKIKGVDIRAHGSGNIGATNVGRVIGKPYGITCFLLDMLKGFLPVFTAGYFMNTLNPALTPSATTLTCWLATIAAAILGHVFPLWLKFKGGKGVATGFGVILGFWPYLTFPAIASALTFALLLIRYKYVSLSSITAAVSLPIYFFIYMQIKNWPINNTWPILLITSILALLIVYMHKSNISRILAGQENKIGSKKDPSEITS